MVKEKLMEKNDWQQRTELLLGEEKGIGQNHHCGSSDDRIWIFTGKRISSVWSVHDPVSGDRL